MSRQKSIIIIIGLVVLVGLAGAACHFNKAEEKSHEVPDFSFAEVNMSEAEVKKNAGEPKYETTDNEEIVAELFEYKYQLEAYIETYEKSDDGEVEKKLAVLHEALQNDPAGKNFKKAVYEITQTDDDGYVSEYQKSIYYLDGKFIY
ncbi:MAG: hypothetical protein LBK58_07160 [Prevotellaceae bacterium]|nr:hypothetical protein [Prevotellaceae bacterium]